MSKGDRLFNKGWKQLTAKGDCVKGMEYMLKAADAGSLAAILFLAELNHTGALNVVIKGKNIVYPVKKDSAAALAYYERLPQTTGVSFIEGRIYHVEDEALADHKKAFILFSNVVEGKCDPDFPEVSLLYDFEFGVPQADIEEEIINAAAKYLGVMHYCGLGSAPDTAAAYALLAAQEERRIKTGKEIAKFWLPEQAFVLEMLKKENESAFLADEAYYNYLFWILENASDHGIKRQAADELIAPNLNRNIFAASAAQDIFGIKTCIDSMNRLYIDIGYINAGNVNLAEKALERYRDEGLIRDNPDIYLNSVITMSQSFDSLKATVLWAEYALANLKNLKSGAVEYLADALNAMRRQYARYADGNAPAGFDKKDIEQSLKAVHAFAESNEDLLRLAAPEDYKIIVEEINGVWSDENVF